jgi:hypothetical protein
MTATTSRNWDVSPVVRFTSSAPCRASKARRATLLAGDVAAHLDQYLGEIAYLFGGPGSLLRGRRRHTFPVMTSGANDLASPNMSLRFLTRDCAGNLPDS